MSSRLQQYQLISNTDFLGQLAGCLCSAAANVINEDAGTANHNQRVSYARGIFADPMAEAKVMAPGILTNPTVATDAGGPVGASGTPVSDSDLDFVVASLLDKYAAYYVARANFGTITPPM